MPKIVLISDTHCYEPEVLKTRHVREYPRRIRYECGQRYHSFVIISDAPTIVSDSGRTYTAWNCLCDCGNYFVSTTKQIRKGVRKSCGCRTLATRFRRLPSKDAITRLKFGHYINSAKARNIVWNLSVQEFSLLLFGDCVYCDSPPMSVVKTKIHKELVNGVDRINSDGIYNIDNCVSCCKICNRAKSNSPLDEFIAWLGRLRVSTYSTGAPLCA